MNAQELARQIIEIAEEALRTGGTWSEADRMEALKEGLRDIVTLCKEQEKQMNTQEVKKLLADALYTDEPHHKQWYLWKLVEALGLDLSDEWDDDYPEPEQGVAP